jgi:prephenate dehydratase
LSSKTIYFLGDLFSFHHLAGVDFFGGDNQFIAASTFDDIISNTQSQAGNFAVVAVENSLAGDVPGNFQRISLSGLTIIGEITAPVELHLAAKSPIQIGDLKTVYSHQMAIKESKRFFEQYPDIEFVNTPSTASAVKLVATSVKQNIAAIGNKSAIAYYHLQVIAENIDNHAENFTRFLILSNNKAIDNTTFLDGKASFLLQPGKTGLPEGLNVHPNISLLRHLENGNVYIETVFLTSQQIINMLSNFEQNGLTVSVLGVYPVGTTMVI